MGRVWLATLLLMAWLAGCADEPAQEDPDAAARAVDVQASRDAGVIKGIVVNGHIQPLEGATVKLEGTTATLTTPATGAFGFEALPPGSYQLIANKEGHATVRQSVTVLAGIDDPPVVRILLAALPSVQPRIEPFQFRAVTGIEYCLPAVGCYPQPGPWDALSDEPGAMPAADIGAGATVAQAEFTWRSQTQLATHGAVSCHSRTGSTTVATEGVQGTSPLAQRIALTATLGQKDLDATRAACRWSLAADDPPVAVIYGQEVDAVMHVFYYFEPDAEWRFGRDGDHPVPGGP